MKNSFWIKDRKIYCGDTLLQDAVDYAINAVKIDLDIDLLNELLLIERNNGAVRIDRSYDVNEYLEEYMCDYKVYTSDLFDYAKSLYFNGYNVLEKAIEYEMDNILLVNQLITDYVIDKIAEYQADLKEYFENEEKENGNS